MAGFESSKWAPFLPSAVSLEILRGQGMQPGPGHDHLVPARPELTGQRAEGEEGRSNHCRKPWLWVLITLHNELICSSWQAYRKVYFKLSPYFKDEKIKMQRHQGWVTSFYLAESGFESSESGFSPGYLITLIKMHMKRGPVCSQEAPVSWPRRPHLGTLRPTGDNISKPIWMRKGLENQMHWWHFHPRKGKELFTLQAKRN